jgi:cell division protein FtsI (penicillin-binding protein 3)
MGFFPADDPKYIMLVKLDKPTSAPFAESTAGPIFHDIAQYIFTYFKIPPTR